MVYFNRYGEDHKILPFSEWNYQLVMIIEPLPRFVLDLKLDNTLSLRHLLEKSG
jgi:hypothetical protein